MAIRLHSGTIKQKQVNFQDIKGSTKPRVFHAQGEWFAGPYPTIEAARDAAGDPLDYPGKELITIGYCAGPFQTQDQVDKFCEVFADDPEKKPDDVNDADSAKDFLGWLQEQVGDSFSPDTPAGDYTDESGDSIFSGDFAKQIDRMLDTAVDILGDDIEGVMLELGKNPVEHSEKFSVLHSDPNKEVDPVGPGHRTPQAQVEGEVHEEDAVARLVDTVLKNPDDTDAWLDLASTAKKKGMQGPAIHAMMKPKLAWMDPEKYDILQDNLNKFIGTMRREGDYQYKFADLPDIFTGKMKKFADGEYDPEVLAKIQSLWSAKNKPREEEAAKQRADVIEMEAKIGPWSGKPNFSSLDPKVQNHFRRAYGFSKDGKLSYEEASKLMIDDMTYHMPPEPGQRDEDYKPGGKEYQDPRGPQRHSEYAEGGDPKLDQDTPQERLWAEAMSSIEKYEMSKIKGFLQKALDRARMLGIEGVVDAEGLKGQLEALLTSEPDWFPHSDKTSDYAEEEKYDPVTSPEWEEVQRKIKERRKIPDVLQYLDDPKAKAMRDKVYRLRGQKPPTENWEEKFDDRRDRNQALLDQSQGTHDQVREGTMFEMENNHLPYKQAQERARKNLDGDPEWYQRRIHGNPAVPAGKKGFKEKENMADIATLAGRGWNKLTGFKKKADQEGYEVKQIDDDGMPGYMAYHYNEPVGGPFMSEMAAWSHIKDLMANVSEDMAEPTRGISVAYEAGYEAGESGISDDNPFTPGSPEAKDWNRGYRSGSHLKNVMDSDAMAEPTVDEGVVQAGKDAYEAGKSDTENPYKDDPAQEQQSSWWEMGYRGTKGSDIKQMAEKFGCSEEAMENGIERYMEKSHEAFVDSMTKKGYPPTSDMVFGAYEFQDGFTAWFNGDKIGSCPHEADTFERLAWETGWKMGESTVTRHGSKGGSELSHEIAESIKCTMPKDSLKPLDDHLKALQKKVADKIPGPDEGKQPAKPGTGKSEVKAIEKHGESFASRPRAQDTVLEILWYDPSPGEWIVTTQNRHGQERNYSADIVCCDPETLDKKSVYEVTSKRQGSDVRAVTSIGEVYASDEDGNFKEEPNRPFEKPKKADPKETFKREREHSPVRPPSSEPRRMKVAGFVDPMQSSRMTGQSRPVTGKGLPDQRQMQVQHGGWLTKILEGLTGPIYDKVISKLEAAFGIPTQSGAEAVVEASNNHPKEEVQSLLDRILGPKQVEASSTKERRKWGGTQKPWYHSEKNQKILSKLKVKK